MLGRSFRPHPLFERAILRTTEVKDLLEDLAEKGAAAYRDGVPIDEGDLRDSVFGDVALTENGYVGRIGASDYKAALVEFGTVDFSPDGSLRRALEGLGLEFEPAEDEYR